MNKKPNVHWASRLGSLHVKVTVQVGDEIYPLLARGQKAEHGTSASSSLPFPCAQPVRLVSMLAPLQPLALLQGNELDPSHAPACVLCVFPRQIFP